MILVVAAALYDTETDSVLMAQRPPGKSHAGEWEFPGGKPETGEGPEEALVRELREEIGVTVAIDAFTPCGFASYTYPERHVLLLLYLARDWQGEPQGLEGQLLQWVAMKDLPDFAVLPADKPLIERLSCYL